MPERFPNRHQERPYWQAQPTQRYPVQQPPLPVVPATQDQERKLREQKDATKAALNDIFEAQRALIEAIYESHPGTCSTLLSRALTQLTHASANVQRGQVCLSVPPELAERLSFRRYPR